jgi:uncharacterized membrane protein
MTLASIFLAAFVIGIAAWHTHSLIEKIPTVLSLIVLVVMAWFAYSQARFISAQKRRKRVSRRRSRAREAGTRPLPSRGV